MNVGRSADVPFNLMWRALLITMLVLQQTLTAWLVPAAAPATAKTSPQQCCCCQAACDSMARGCDSDTPRRCAPSSTQRPLNSDATVVRIEARIRSGVADNRGELLAAFGTVGFRPARFTAHSSVHDQSPDATVDARTRRAMLCVRTT